MVVAGRDVETLITNNIYQGLTAKAKFVAWKRCQHMDQAALLKRLKSIYTWIPSNLAAKKLMADLIQQLGGKI